MRYHAKKGLVDGEGAYWPSATTQSEYSARMSEFLRAKFPLLYNMFAAIDDDDRANSLRERYCHTLKAAETHLPGISFYFDGHLHDSWVLGIEHQKNHLTIRLNDFSSHCICDAFAKLRGLSSTCEHHIMPVSLQFENITSCSLSRINHKDQLIPVRGRQKYMRKLREYLLDEIRDISPDHIAVGILFFTNKQHLVLEIEARSLAFQEDQKKAFIELFGPEHSAVFDEYWSERHAGKDFHQSSAIDFLRTRIPSVPQRKTLDGTAFF